MAITSTLTGTGLSDVNIPLCAINRSLVPAPSVTPSLQLPMADANGLMQLGLWEDERGSTINLPDFEGLLKEIPLNIPALSGSRVVQNLLTYTEDFDNAVWTAAGGGSPTIADNGEGVGIATWPTGGLGNITQQLQGEASEGKTHVWTVDLKLVSGSPTEFQVRIEDNGSGADSVLNVTTELSSEWKRFSIEHANTATSTNISFIIRNQTNTGSEIIVHMRRPQAEKVTGQANQNPSEYVPVGVGTGPNIVTNGTFDDATDWQVSGPEWSVIGGQAVCDGTQVSSVEIRQLDVFSIEDLDYVVEFDLIAIAGGSLKVQLGGPGSDNDIQFNSPGSKRATLKVQGIGTFNALRFVAGPGVSVTMDNVVCRRDYQGFAYYTRQNNITVDGSGVVNDPGPGALITPAPHWEHWPQSTNIEEYSESTIGKGIVRASIAVDDETSPSGTLNADKLIANTDNNTHYIYDPKSFTSGVTYCYSYFAKADELTQCGMQFFSTNAVFNNEYARFDLSSGTVLTTSGVGDSGIESFGNGWYRVWATATAAVTGSGNIGLKCSKSDSFTFVGNASDGFHFWGMQAEASDFPTPYIPNLTTGSSTRFATLMRYPFSAAVFNQAEGMLVTKINFGLSSADSPTGTQALVGINDGVLAGLLYDHNSPTLLASYDGSGSSNTISVDWLADNLYYLVVIWNANDSEYFVGLRDIDGAGNYIWSTSDTNYDGDFASSDDFIRLFQNNSNFYVFPEIDLYTTYRGKAWIEANY